METWPAVRLTEPSGILYSTNRLTLGVGASSSNARREKLFSLSRRDDGTALRASDWSLSHWTALESWPADQLID